MTKQAIIEHTIQVINQLPEDKAEQISDFANFLFKRYEEQLRTKAIQHYTESGEAFQFVREDDVEYTKADIKEFFKHSGSMSSSLIPIGNSKGIRLTKTLIEKYNIKDAVELVLEKDHIIIRPKTSPRKGWAKSFKKMHENGDDKLSVPDVFEDEHPEEWS